MPTELHRGAAEMPESGWAERNQRHRMAKTSIQTPGVLQQKPRSTHWELAISEGLALIWINRCVVNVRIVLNSMLSAIVACVFLWIYTLVHSFICGVVYEPRWIYLHLFSVFTICVCVLSDFHFREKHTFSISMHASDVGSVEPTSQPSFITSH